MKTRNKFALSAFSLLCLSCSYATYSELNLAQKHVDKAYALAGDTFMRTTAELQCSTDNRAMKYFSDKSVPPATKIFDNLYYVGVTPVGAYALQTSDGIILIDALDNTELAQNVIETGMRSLGLDPAEIKMIVVTHGHGDHYGGARYLAEKYKASVIMSEVDWELAINPPPRLARPGMPAPKWSAAPDKDLVATDGQELTLGDTNVKLVLTPGHTPGTLSLIFPVTENGKTHTAALWGGTGIPKDMALVKEYVKSASKFAKLEREYAVDVALSNHPFVDDSLNRMQVLRENPDKANPFIIGQQMVQDYTKVIEECAAAAVARMTTN
ncbi:MAG: MBL fold metallo-hydrolase [Paraglaciecola sp.]|uniref:MBL fold metallo-hydrolase n=1 Tax=Paraglaciecola sp. TaxID=1920173 RepID=UPI0032973B2B